MTLTRKDWKAIGELVLTVGGPSYADSLRAKAQITSDPVERQKLVTRADLVDGFAANPKETVDDAGIVWDALFGKPKRRRRKGSRKR